MNRTIYDPILPDVDAGKRKEVQESFGRHLVEQRNRMAALVRKWIETDTRFPIPVYDRLIEKIRKMDPSSRAEIASIALLMADQIVTAILTAFDTSDELQVDGQVVNYAIIAQIRKPNCDEVLEQIDVNRGKPMIAAWDAYGRWLTQFAPSDARPVASRDR